MKKIIAWILMMVSVLCLFGCGTAYNYDTLDTQYHFDRAIIRLPDGQTISGNVDRWRDFDNNSLLQITINGVTYLVHAENATLIAGSE